MNLMTQKVLLEAIEKTDKLVPSARTLGRALQLLRNLNSSLIEIAQLINCDSALAVEVLKCANSAYYGRPARVGSIGEAMNLIGFAETKRFVSLAVAQKSTKRPLKSYGISAEEYWAESLFNGYFLEALVVRIGAGDPTEAYIVGLLRFVGRLVIDQALQTAGIMASQAGTPPFTESERSLVGLTQSEVGGRLLRRWSFPERIVEALESQDRTTNESTFGAAPLSDCMRFVAEILPDGKRFAALNAKAGGAIVCPDDHPFLIANRLDAEVIAGVYQSAYGSCSAIREILRASSEDTQDWDF